MNIIVFLFFIAIKKRIESANLIIDMTDYLQHSSLSSSSSSLSGLPIALLIAPTVE